MHPKPPIRIANASGAINDAPDQLHHLSLSAPIDAITADYLAEFNLAWKALELTTHPDLGYEPGFLSQLAYRDGSAARQIARRGIKVVHNGGALNPEGLARATDAYFKSLGIEGVRVAWVTGDDVTGVVKEGEAGRLMHLDQEGVELEDSHRGRVLSANVYTGMSGIVAALEAGAQIVVCGRCTDASPVMGLAAWWHGWGVGEWDKLAGSLMAGHLIECGAYVTGGNYVGWREIEKMHHVGYPIAEIAHDGTPTLTKPPLTNGALTPDTCTAQLLYELQGPLYLNPNVTAHLTHAVLTPLAKNRIRLTGITGSPPPPTSKLAICLHGGWQSELCAYAAGLDTREKFELMKEQVRRELDGSRFSTLSMEVYGSGKENPASQQESTVMMRLFAQSEDKDALASFKRAIFYNGMQGYCGLHLAMDWRTMEPRPYVRYFPRLVPSSGVRLKVRFVGDEGAMIEVPPRGEHECAARAAEQESYDPVSPAALESFGEMERRPLGDLVFARSGDKGGNANVGFWVRDRAAWPWLRAFLTKARCVELLGEDWKDHYKVERCEFAGLMAVHFVIKGLLQEGVSSSSVLDGFGKSVSEFMRARHVDLPTKLLQMEQHRRTTMRGKL